MKKSKGKKIVIGLVVGVLATTAIVCAAVPQVRQSIKDLISKIKGEKTPEEKENERKEKAHDDDFYKDLDDEEKNEFDKKLNDIVDSDHYKNLDDEEKDKLLDKFVESEKTIKEVSQDPKDKKPEEIENNISNKQSELENIQKEIEDLKNSGASEEEIAKAEEKQQQVENQIKSAEQEKAYWETVETVKDSTTNNTTFSIENPGTTIRRINGIYSYEGIAYFNIDVVKEEIIDGRSYYSQSNQFCSIDRIITGEETYQEILKIISSKQVVISVEKTCMNKNSQEQKDYFEKNKSSMDGIFDILENNGYNLSIIESWQTTTSEYPEFIINAKSENDEMMYMATYSPELARYRVQPIQKICPEFWAQLEIERSQTAKTSAEAKAQAALDEISTKDENGEMTGFDWNAYRALKEKQEAKDQERISSQNADQKVELSYSEKELGF